MGSFSPEPPKPWVETPLIFSPPISRAAGCNIYLKLENTQPSGSFKSRYVPHNTHRLLLGTPLPDPLLIIPLLETAA
jgi:L-serine/L-threonine ammonia-lyase